MPSSGEGRGGSLNLETGPGHRGGPRQSQSVGKRGGRRAVWVSLSLWGGFYLTARGVAVFREAEGKGGLERNGSRSR